ncbi:hypothetical protein PoB_002473200 [Plakobranchus ocellatus]|uniref:Uncharacterized protein n=1 Tax=Plakobranchus ocellatus TaxID=259542 RepID=A0AAV3ZUJ7_9GAST|nr:hypothetical protein PoB_002473200 [Plakobranchus ocellatus]
MEEEKFDLLNRGNIKIGQKSVLTLGLLLVVFLNIPVFCWRLPDLEIATVSDVAQFEVQEHVDWIRTAGLKYTLYGLDYSSSQECQSMSRCSINHLNFHDSAKKIFVEFSHELSANISKADLMFYNAFGEYFVRILTLVTIDTLEDEDEQDYSFFHNNNGKAYLYSLSVSTSHYFRGLTKCADLLLLGEFYNLTWDSAYNYSTVNFFVLPPGRKISVQTCDMSVKGENFAYWISTFRKSKELWYDPTSIFSSCKASTIMIMFDDQKSKIGVYSLSVRTTGRKFGVHSLDPDNRESFTRGNGLGLAWRSKKTKDLRVPILRGEIRGREVDMMRITGCEGVFVRKKLVEVGQLIGESCLLIRIDDTVLLSEKAVVNLRTPSLSIEVKALCVPNAICNVILENVEGARGLRILTCL